MAHRESNEREGEAGDALWPANQATTAVGAEEEDGVGDGAPGRPASCGSVVGTGTSRRSSGARRRGEGGPVAAVVLVGGDGCVRVRARESEQRGGASRKSERGPRGWRGVSGRRGGRQGGCHGEAGGGRRSSGARHASPLPTGRGRRGQGGKEVGWATQVGCTGEAGPAQVSARYFFSFLFIYCFLFFFCFVLV